MPVAVLFLMVVQPMYEGPEDIVYLTPASFDDHVVDGKGGEKGAKWLVRPGIERVAPTMIHPAT